MWYFLPEEVKAFSLSVWECKGKKFFLVCNKEEEYFLSFS
jgi:hypothetical protein